ncbi:MAG: glycosyltransferase [archaeon]|nr:glycosyltransferase [archaeon]MCP8306167.1 glycosyltransferase [archaeon]
MINPDKVYKTNTSKAEQEKQVESKNHRPYIRLVDETRKKSFITPSDVTIVLPTLNEEEAIDKVVKEVRSVGFENILVVDGYSTDKTVGIAKENGLEVIFQHGRGKSKAMETAVNHVETPYMLVMDCDCTYDPKEVLLLMDHGEQFDMVIGARRNCRGNIPLMNRFGNWVITKAFNTLLGKGLSDVCSGMYLLHTDMAKKLEFSTSGFSTEVEIASQLAVDGSITEVPVTYRKRVGKQKLSRWRDGFKILLSVFNLARKHNPVLLFSSIAASASIPALILLLWVIYENLVNHIWHSGYALFGVMLLLLASQGFTVATISILLKRIERRLRYEISRKELA